MSTETQYFYPKMTEACYGHFTKDHPFFGTPCSYPYQLVASSLLTLCSQVGQDIFKLCFPKKNYGLGWMGGWVLVGAGLQELAMASRTWLLGAVGAGQQEWASRGWLVGVGQQRRDSRGGIVEQRQQERDGRSWLVRGGQQDLASRSWLVEDFL